ncbi:MAG: tRNA (N6-isopentenyl adenosine(37)-C2)-methylthiotransferase MiaB [Gammaproteobacteria bacterium]|nr:tRNA (N6-isopentenyl adenosine(37)-C2)-methylthiotransferase MiaB [Gammaproteobacteria bacterium]
MLTLTPKKLFIQTYGCQMNEYDSSAMANVLHKSHQMELTQDPAEADILLINTCSIRHKAEQKFFSELGQWREYKENRPEILIGVGGCVASQEGSNIRSRAPYVDLVFGPQTLHRLPEMVNEVISKRRPVIDISFPEIEKFDHLPAPRAEGVKAFVSIMEGCSKYCSYCVVPFTRGQEISRPFEDIIKEVQTLSEQGVREITLLGQNVNDYRGKMQSGETADLALLINYIGAMDNILRIRFSTSHPLAFSNRLIQAYATEPKLANQLHLPVQSGSDRILTAMKRGYTALEFKSKIKKLKQVRPDISITSDFIVGFPNETDEDFEATLKLVEEINFDNSYSFIYSKRPGTPAANLPDNISEETKKNRLQILQAKLVHQMDQHSLNMLGTTQSVLVEGLSKKSDQEMTGRTESNRIVNFKGTADLIGKIIPVKITDIKRVSLQGEMI